MKGWVHLQGKRQLEPNHTRIDDTFNFIRSNVPGSRVLHGSDFQDPLPPHTRDVQYRNRPATRTYCQLVPQPDPLAQDPQPV